MAITVGGVELPTRGASTRNRFGVTSFNFPSDDGFDPGIRRTDRFDTSHRSRWQGQAPTFREAMEGAGRRSRPGPVDFSDAPLSGGPTIFSRPRLREVETRSFEDIVGPMPGASGGSSSGAASFAAGFSSLADAQRRAADAMGALEAQYEARKQELREAYQLTETPEERASIQHVLAVIEAQRSAGTKVIERVYGQAIEGAAAQAEQTRALGVEAGERTAENFAQAADRSVDALTELGQEFGGTTGAGGEALSPVVEGIVGDLNRRGATEAAFDERMFGITADDIAFLGEAMRPEMGAQVGGLQRIAASTGAAAQAQHMVEVNRRISQERANLQAAEQNLMGMFDQRQFGLQDQLMAIDLERARIEQQQAQMRQQASQFNRSQSASLSPAQEWALRQEEIRLQEERARAQQEFQAQVLGSAFGISPEHALAAALFGVGGEIVANQPTPGSIELLQGLQGGVQD